MRPDQFSQMMKYLTRPSMARGGRIGFADGLSFMEFGEEQTGTTAQNLRRQLSPGQKNEIVPKIIRQALKESGIKFNPGKGSGSKATFDNVTKETIKKFNETVRKLKTEQGIQMNLADANVLKKKVKDFVLDKLKKGEYVSRPIIKKELNLPEGSADSIITKALGERQGSGQGAPYKGGLLDKLGKEERKIIMSEQGKKRVKAKLKSSDEVIKALNEEFKFDPDVERGPELTRRIYGDAFDKADAAGKADLMNQVDNDIKKYLRALEGGYKPKGMKLPNQEIINDIIDRIDTGEFKFSSGTKRGLLFDAIDNLLGLRPGTFKTQRRNLTKKGFELDEIFGLSGVSRKAPGYAEAYQLISSEANQAKKNIIDLPLSKLLNAIDEDKKSVIYKKKKMSLDEAIKNFNKDSLKFSNEYNIKSPKINKGVKFNKLNYKNFSNESLKNIENVYKNKNYFLSEVKNKPIQTFNETLKTPNTSKKVFSSQLSANPMFNPGILKQAFKTIPTPLSTAALTAGFGVDSTSSIDRASIAAEAAFAPSLVKQSAKMGAAQRLFNLGFNPKMAMRIARVASPIGIASLGAEGAYQLGKFTKKRIGELKEMSPEQRQELTRKGDEFAFSEFSAAGGGIAKLAGIDQGPPPESGPNSQGLQGLLKRVRKG